MGKNKRQRIEDQDARDRQVLLEEFAPDMVRCAGGRLIVERHTCFHCNAISPGAACNAPMAEVIKPRKPVDDGWVV